MKRKEKRKRSREELLKRKHILEGPLRNSIARYMGPFEHDESLRKEWELINKRTTKRNWKQIKWVRSPYKHLYQITFLYVALTSSTILSSTYPFTVFPFSMRSLT